MSELPRWVWDLVADLLDEEDMHPKLFIQAFSMATGRHEWTQYGWCPSAPLARVPDDVLVRARAIAGYREKPTESTTAGTDPTGNPTSSERTTDG